VSERTSIFAEGHAVLAVQSGSSSASAAPHAGGRTADAVEAAAGHDMKITDAFIAEHAVIYAQLDFLEHAIPAARTLGEVKVMAGLLEAALKPHAEAEDELLFNGLEPGLDQMGKLEKVQHEHDAICKGLELVQAARTKKDAQRRLLNVVHLTRKEFDLEDRIIFRMAEELLREDTLVKLGKTWARQRVVPAR
jgi:hemerythrin-like domain-containing protein